MSAPLPLAPRPYTGEAVSSWIRRIGARYDIVADALLEHVLDRPRRAIDVASTLDYQAAPDLEAALAYATRISPVAISSLRIAGDDGANSCWHRWALAWCPICFRADLADHGETYERAIWRLGSCVVCPEHDVPLEDSCCRCPFEDRCHFYCSGGFLGLACNTCRRPEGPEPRRPHDWWGDEKCWGFRNLHHAFTQPADRDPAKRPSGRVHGRAAEPVLGVFTVCERPRDGRPASDILPAPGHESAM